MIPALNFDKLVEIIMRLAAMKFFPGNIHARLAIAEGVGDMVHSEDEAKWLVKRALILYTEWPGLVELRALLSSKVKPKDGFEAYSNVYPDGIPSERPERELLVAPAQPKRIGPGEAVSAAASLNDTVRDLVELKDMNRFVAARRVREIPVVRITDANRITEADIERARREYREKKAQAEAGLADAS